VDHAAEEATARSAHPRHHICPLWLLLGRLDRYSKWMDFVSTVTSDCSDNSEAQFLAPDRWATKHAWYTEGERAVSKGFKDPSGKFHPTDGDDDSSNGAVMGVAVAIVVSGLISGGVGGATSVSGSVSESYGSRTSSSQSDARTSRGEPDARTSGITDSFRITSRLKRLGYRVKFQAEPKQTNCDAHSDGDVRAFFVEHPCLSIYRQLIEIDDKKNVIMLGAATI
jgi:hypothetical protein